MIDLFHTVILFWSVYFTGFQLQEFANLDDYDLKSPTAIMMLPEILGEISGICSIDATTFACVQDEVGVVYIYDSVKGQITGQIPFSGKGDFEGIALVNKTFYVLRSDGLLFEINDYQAKAPTVRFYDTGIPARDNEGLCYDISNRRLLIACKGGYKDPDVKNRHLVFSFDLVSGKLSAEPLFVIDVKTVRKLIKEKDIKVPGADKDKIDHLGFPPSEICINPLTGKVFVLSGRDNILIVTDLNGRIESIEPLKKDLFRQAEGITFTRSGDLYISNEAAGKKPMLLRYNLIKKSY